jgi:hypothetical protein
VNEAELEDTLRSSNFIYDRAYRVGFEAGQREAYSHLKRLIEQAQKLALLNKQAE